MENKCYKAWQSLHKRISVPPRPPPGPLHPPSHAPLSRPPWCTLVFPHVVSVTSNQPTRSRLFLLLKIWCLWWLWNMWMLPASLASNLAWPWPDLVALVTSFTSQSLSGHVMTQSQSPLNIPSATHESRVTEILPLPSSVQCLFLILPGQFQALRDTIRCYLDVS